MKKTLLLLAFTTSLAVNAQSWVTQATGFTEPSRGIDEIKIVDANIVWAKAYDGSGAGAEVQEFTLTTNGGTTWSAGSTFTGDYRLLTYVPGTLTIVSTSQATGLSGSAYSSNNGLTWTDIDFGTQRGVSAFLNGTTGWCAGFSTDATTGGIFKFDGTLSNESFDATTTFKVYPNPASSLVTISSDIDAFVVSVTDLTGKVVLEKSMSGIENTVDVSSFTSGVYFFTISSDAKKETIKIIKN